jgi:hypothetical protein
MPHLKIFRCEEWHQFAPQTSSSFGIQQSFFQQSAKFNNQQKEIYREGRQRQ